MEGYSDGSNSTVSVEQTQEHSYSELHYEDSQSQIECVSQCDQSKKPFVGQKFPDIDSGFNFYKDYGRICGFDGRRASHKKNLHGNIEFKYFLCSKAGVKPDLMSNIKTNPKADSGTSNSLTETSVKGHTVLNRQRRRISRKCGCTAMLSLKSIGNDGFIIHSFIETHNHKLADINTRQFLRCNRALTDVHKKFIIDVSKNYVGATRAHGIFKSLSGTFENVGATKVDFKKFSRDIKKYIGIHDTDMILQKFKDKYDTSDNGFKYEYEVDSENRLTRLFWADAVGRCFYTVYGDCVSFVATYRTNKYKMIFVPFVGIDNHWRSVTFAAALLSQEDVENFEWVCEAFKKVMGPQPKCVIRDQCPAMNIVIPKCFSQSKHRYCMWHIMKKFPSKLGTLFCVESPFMDKISKFIWMDHASPSEFEKGWTKVISEFGLEDHKWLSELYDLRHKWIPAYFNEDPMVGLLRTTSRSESSNFFFNHFVEKGDTLSEFYLCYESAIEKQRHENHKMNHDDTGRPDYLTPKKIERDASELYTLSIFYKVQEEIRAGYFDTQMHSMTTEDSIKTLILKDEFVKDKLFQVEVDTDTLGVECSCHMYTRVGFLYKHAFFSLVMCGIDKIPRHLLKDRWMKNAEQKFKTLQLGELSDSCAKENRIRSKKMECWFDFQSCMSAMSNNENLVDVASDAIKELKKRIYDINNKVSARIDDNVIEQLIGSWPTQEINVLPPKQSNNKGSRKRLANSAEKSIGGIKRQMRECKKCGVRGFHDSRNCDMVQNIKADKDGKKQKSCDAKKNLQ